MKLVPESMVYLVVPTSTDVVRAFVRSGLTMPKCGVGRRKMAWLATT